MSVGYDAAHLRSEAAAGVLRDMALLIGEPSPDPIALETGGELAPGLGFREDAAALAVRARDLSQGLFKIIVLGEFKNGKSTLLNGMLGSKVLPAKAAPATAIITVLVYGDDPRVAVYESGASLNRRSRREPRLVSWEDFVREFQLSRQDQETLQDHGTVDRFRHVEYAQIECHHPICASGVKLIDSPGLGEHISRTRVATNFLKQSQAVIFVLNATRILTQDERDFIDNVLGRGRLNHVFFVVNRINQVDEADAEEIRRWVERGLMPHFLDEHGAFDRDFYERRVFFVDARGALDAAADSADEARREATGVPALERELERFLTTDEKIAAALQSTVQFLQPVVRQACRRIAQEKAALDQPLEELERRRAEAERQLQALGTRKHEIERTILLFGETVKQKVYSDLRAFVDEMHETWPEDARRLIDLDRALTLKNLMTAYARPEARERL
ncbi:MAG: dynamin family protein, partial [Chloroflexi bacterium]|nr:dynamin family protein [Chloroflexota bacterium]